MRRSPAQLVLFVLGVGCAGVGVWLWGEILWRSVTEGDEVSATSDEGGRLVGQVLVGTLLGILGTVLLHLAHGPAEADGDEDDAQDGDPGTRAPGD